MIRPVQVEEYPAICAALTALAPWVRLNISAEHLLINLCNDPQRRVLAYDVDGEAAGALIYWTKGCTEMLFQRGFGQPLAVRHGVPWPCQWTDVPESGYIGSLGVFSAEHRGHGIGRKLLEHAERLLVAEGHSYVRLQVSDFNDSARSLYARRGYEEVGHVPDCIVPGYGEYLMEKPAPAPR